MKGFERGPYLCCWVRDVYLPQDGIAIICENDACRT